MEKGKFDYPLIRQTLEVSYTVTPTGDHFQTGELFVVEGVRWKVEPCPGHDPFWLDIGDLLSELPVDEARLEQLLYSYYLDKVKA